MPNPRRFALMLLAAAAASALSGCQMVAARLATDFGLELEEQVEAAPGSAIPITVTVTRPLPVGELVPLPVTVRLDDEPDWLSAEAVTTEAGDDTLELLLEVGADAPLGEHEITVFASNGMSSEKETFTLAVVE